MENRELLAICAWCNKIKVSDNPAKWLSRTNENERLYNLFIKEFKDDLTHTICTECAEREEQDYHR